MNRWLSNDLADAKTIGQLLAKRAQQHTDRVAIEFLGDGISVSESVTYGQLHTKAASVARFLQSRQMTDNTVLLVFPQGIDYAAAFFGCLYAGAVAVPAYPPRRNRNLDRLRSMATDSDASIVLTTNELLESMSGSVDEDPSLSQRHWQAIDDASIQLTYEAACDFETPDSPDSLAFLQYTSGSTGSPKGVMVSNHNLMENQDLITEIFGQREDEAIVCGWLPMYHDMGLIGNLLHPIYLGGKLVLMSPFTFFQKPLCWLQAISDHRATIAGGPNFAYEMCAAALDELPASSERKLSLDLSSWNLAFNGAEPVRDRTLQAFTKAAEPCGFSPNAFSPCFGMAETTLIVSGIRRPDHAGNLQVFADDLQQGEAARATIEDSRPSLTLVSSGAPGTGLDVRIVDPKTNTEMEAGRVGEVWVHGTSVTGGYWNRPELTESVFKAQLAGDSQNAKPYLRTGDLGFVSDGELFITGRLKDMIIVHGANHYPSDIEETVGESHSALAVGNGVAFAVEIDEEEAVFVAHELKRSQWRQFNKDEVVSAIFGRVFQEHGLALSGILLLRPGSIPKTTSGKLQRSLTRKLYEEDDLQVVANWLATEGTPLAESGENPNQSIDEDLGDKQLAELKALESWLTSQIAILLKTEAEKISTTQPLSMYGLNSMSAVRMAGSLTEHLQREIDPALAYNYPTIRSICRHLILGEATRGGIAAQRAVSDSQSCGDLQIADDPIAIVGMACRFPGAASTSAFWDLLISGRCAIREGRGSLPAGYLDDIDQFDPGFFGISPREADEMDPQQRLAIETVWRAIEQANIDPSQLAGSATGVFFGVSSRDYERLALAAGHATNGHSATGVSSAIVANRLSYLFDFQGPSLSIDTACSSSLVAVHQACEAIRGGGCDVAVAGGVSLMLANDVTQAFQQAGMLSPSGTCKTFAEGADGFVRGEGCGAVLLKRLSQAQADADNVIAVIRGSAVNQDGRSNGLTAPSGLAQQEVITTALARAGVAADEIDYIESHGTGTELGDPIEVGALAGVFSQRHVDAENRALQIGSVKTNIGHLEAAAGIAGLIKTCLALQNQVIPAHLHFDQPSPHINWNHPIEVAASAAIWVGREASLRRAGVSSFGFGGTNAHVIVEEADVERSEDEAAEIRQPEDSQQPDWMIVKLSAKSDAALDILQDEVSTDERLREWDLFQIAASANLGRGDFEHRLAVVTTDTRDFCRQLTSSSESALRGEAACENEELTRRAAHATAAIKAIVHGSSSEASENSDSIRGHLLEIASAYASGAVVDWLVLQTALCSLPRKSAAKLGRFSRPVTLPGHPLQRSRHWFTTNATTKDTTNEKPTQSATHSHGQSLLGRPLDVGADLQIFEVDLSMIAFLQDHRLRGEAVFPTTGYVEQGLQIANFMGAESLEFAELQIHKAVAIPVDKPCRMQVIVQASESENSFACNVVHRENDQWRCVAEYQLLESSRAAKSQAPAHSEAAGGPISVASHFARCREAGLEYGPAFCGLTELNVIDRVALGKAELPAALETTTREGSQFSLHPALLDACLQTLSPLVANYAVGVDETELWLPVGLQRCIAHTRASAVSGLSIAATLTADHASGCLIGDIWIDDASTGQRVCEIQGLRLSSGHAPQEVTFYESTWIPKLRDHEQSSPANISATEVVEKVVAVRDAIVARTGLIDTLEARSQLNGLCRDWIIECLMHFLGDISEGVRFTAGQGSTASGADSVRSLGIQDDKRRCFARMMAMLVEDDLLEIAVDSGDKPIWILKQDLQPTDVAAQSDRLMKQHAHLSAELALLSRCGKQLAEVLVGEVEPLELLFPLKGEVTAADVYKVSPGARTINALLAASVSEIVNRWPEGRGIRVLEIGAGTGGTTQHVLDSLPENRYAYRFTDIGNSFLAAARQTLASFDAIDYQILDIEAAPTTEDLGKFDIIVAANVLHATRDLRETSANIRSLLADGGQLLLLEGTRPVRWMDLTFGLTEGWWRFNDAVRSDYPLANIDQWSQVLSDSGFDDVCVIDPLHDQEAYEAENVVVVATAGKTKASRSGEHWIVVGDDKPRTQRLAKRLIKEGSSCDVVHRGEALSARLSEALTQLPARQNVVFLAPKPSTGNDESQQAHSACIHLMQTIQKLIDHETRELNLVLAASKIDDNPTGRALRGMMRAVQLEQPQWTLRSIEVDATKERFARLAVAEMQSFDAEPEVRLTETLRSVRRLRDASSDAIGEANRVLRARSQGSLDNLHFENTKRREPKATEIEIAVLAAGLNYRDVLLAMGMYPGEAPLGAECVGRVVRLGNKVADKKQRSFAVGDFVIAFAEETFADFATVSAERVVRIPQRLLPSDLSQNVKSAITNLATLPVAFLTASFGLETLGKIESARRVLIHSATGGVGLAALQIAKAHGVEIFATASRNKWAMLHEMGIDHVYDSRDNTFGQQILDDTNQQGVALILNTLPEERFAANVQALADDGIFVDITKPSEDLATQLREAKDAAKYHLLDLVEILQDEPARAVKRLKKVITRVEEGLYQPLPCESFSLDRVTDAMRKMQLARHTGKLVVHAPQIQQLAAQRVTEFEDVPIREDSAYVIFGGLGDLGLLTAEILADRGARNIALVGRSKPNEKQRQAVDALIQRPCNVIVLQADATCRDEVDAALKAIRKRDLKIAGVVHSAGVLHDGFIQNQDEQSFSKVFDVKAVAAWHLHELTQDDPLDLFVVYSSMASMLGAPGQSNHSAANAFLDGLIADRRAAGFVGSAIQWGPWSQLGEAARRSADQRADIQGIGVIQPVAGIKAIRHTLARKSMSLGVANIAVDALPSRLQTHPLFQQLVQANSTNDEVASGEIVLQIAAAAKNQRLEMMYDFIRATVCEILGMADTSRVSRTTVLTDIGLDSLTAMELKDTLEADLGVALPASLVYDYPTLGELSEFLLQSVSCREQVTDENEELSSPQEPDCEEVADCEDVEAASAPVVATPSGGLTDKASNDTAKGKASSEETPASPIPIADDVRSSLMKLQKEINLWES